MRSPRELLDSYEESARSAAEFAELAASKGNAALALQDWTEAAGSHFFRALVAWRSGLIDPRPGLTATVNVSGSAVAYLRSTDVGPLREGFNSVPGAWAAALLGWDSHPIMEELEHLAVRRTPRNVPPDWPLEAWLMRALRGADVSEGRDLALTLGNRRQLRLLAESSTTYFDLASVDRADTASAHGQTRRALELFALRRRDGFFAGGVHYEGGDEYNGVVIDFHVAAIWRARGWDPSGLSDDERRHVVMPG